jgi:hypothetical protein
MSTIHFWMEDNNIYTVSNGVKFSAIKLYFENAFTHNPTILNDCASSSWQFVPDTNDNKAGFLYTSQTNYVDPLQKTSFYKLDNSNNQLISISDIIDSSLNHIEQKVSIQNPFNIRYLSITGQETVSFDDILAIYRFKYYDKQDFITSFNSYMPTSLLPENVNLTKEELIQSLENILGGTTGNISNLSLTQQTQVLFDDILAIYRYKYYDSVDFEQQKNVYIPTSLLEENSSISYETLVSRLDIILNLKKTIY